MTDNEWVELLRLKPKEAHYELIKEYGNLVYAIVLSKLRGIACHEEIKDCVSDVFVEIFRSTDKFCADKGTLKSFVSSIAKNTALNSFDKMRRTAELTTSADDENSFLQLPDTKNDIEERQHRRLLWESVRKLGKPDSTIIVYQYLYGFKVNEIAEKLSMTPAAVQKRSVRAREQLRKIIEEEM